MAGKELVRTGKREDGEGISGRQWRVGVLLKGSTKRCSVLFNDGDREDYDRSEQVQFISHAQPCVLSGPYQFYQFERLGVTVKESPLPPRKPPKVIKQEKPAIAETGQRVIALRRDEWHLGTIVDLRKPTGLWAWADPFPIVIIKFDNGFTYGYPHAVERFWPISTDLRIAEDHTLKVEPMRSSNNLDLKRKESSGASTHQPASAKRNGSDESEHMQRTNVAFVDNTEENSLSTFCDARAKATKS